MAFVLLALAMGSAPVAAQSNEPIFRVKVTTTSPPKIATDLGSATAYFNVTIESSQPGNPLSDSFRHDVTLALTYSPANARGWEVGRLSETTFSLPLNQPKQVSVTLKVTLHNPPEDQVKVIVKATSKPTFQGQTNPATAAIVEQMKQASSHEATASVERDLKGSEAVVAFAKDNAMYLVAFSGGLLVLGVLFAKRKKGGLAVSSPQPVLEVLPGRGASFPVQVTNDSKRRQKVNVATSDVPAGWAAILPVDSLDLNGGESTTIWVTVKAPSTARQGESVKLSFLGTGDDAGEAAEQLLEANVVERYEPSPAPETPTAPEPMAAEPIKRRSRRA